MKTPLSLLRIETFCFQKSSRANFALNHTYTHKTLSQVEKRFKASVAQIRCVFRNSLFLSFKFFAQFLEQIMGQKESKDRLNKHDLEMLKKSLGEDDDEVSENLF